MPTVAIVLSILWYRKRLRRLQTDPGGTKPNALEKQLEQQRKEDVEELRIVQQEYKRLLAERLPRLDEVPEIKKIVPEIEKIVPEIKKIVLEISPEPKVAVEKKLVVVEEIKVVVVAKQQLESVPESKTLSPVLKMKAKVATTAAAVEQQVEQITELTAKISVDVQQTQPQPRDSANTSPAEAMLASPTISHDSDTHSVVSSMPFSLLIYLLLHFFS